LKAPLLTAGLFLFVAYFLPFGLALDALAAAFLAGATFFAVAFVAMLVTFFSPSHGVGLSPLYNQVSHSEANLYLIRLIPNSINPILLTFLKIFLLIKCDSDLFILIYLNH